ncbi:sigma-70 family RNA polymerase sigma factor [Microbulbifer sp.]|uniref:sigma-70 family RNA polymerase sigma factor n=1 Tax=Microbulbifer sp. TaxID=1908541 RepID=UPI002587D66A|nr:sigma-70 family RNA polymerase sigma factor [Microbulbifer sp.]
MYADKLYGLTDEALLNHYHQTRNLNAFKLLYKRHNNQLFRYCIQISQARGCQLLEDLWREILEAPPKLSGRRLNNWFYIQINRRLQCGEFSGDRDYKQGKKIDAELKQQIQTALKDTVFNAVQKLPRPHRNIFLLHRECRLSLATIADIERLSLKECRDLLHSAFELIETTLHGSPHKPWKTELAENLDCAAKLPVEDTDIGIWERIKEKVRVWSAPPVAGREDHPVGGTEKIA